jgi:hypothetical protein
LLSAGGRRRDLLHAGLLHVVQVRIGRIGLAALEMLSIEEHQYPISKAQVVHFLETWILSVGYWVFSRLSRNDSMYTQRAWNLRAPGLFLSCLSMYRPARRKRNTIGVAFWRVLGQIREKPCRIEGKKRVSDVWARPSCAWHSICNIYEAVRDAGNGTNEKGGLI